VGILDGVFVGMEGYIVITGALVVKSDGVLDGKKEGDMLGTVLVGISVGDALGLIDG